MGVSGRVPTEDLSGWPCRTLVKEAVRGNWARSMRVGACSSPEWLIGEEGFGAPFLQWCGEFAGRNEKERIGLSWRVWPQSARQTGDLVSSLLTLLGRRTLAVRQAGLGQHRPCEGVKDINPRSFLHWHLFLPLFFPRSEFGFSSPRHPSVDEPGL